IPYAVDTFVCAPDDGWKYYPKHVEQFPDINKLCNVASCWIYIGILLGAHPIFHISRIKVKSKLKSGNACFHSVPNLLSSSLLPTNLKITIYRAVIMPVVLYGCENWSLTLREERR